MKIAVIGYSGAGKSTLAVRLAEEYGCEALHLDRVNFVAGWQLRDREQARAMVEWAMAQQSWVIDGNYRELLQERRFAEADRILFLDFPRRICIPRALRRYRQYRGTVRESIAEGCEEKFDWEFFWWLLHKGRTKEIRARYRAVIAQYPQKTVVLRRPKDVERFLKEISLQKERSI